MTYFGSKRKYAKYILPILQKAINENNVNTFIDCCCGGCNIIRDIKCGNRIAIDNNKYLIALYKEMQKDGFQFPPHPTREDWDKCKDFPEQCNEWYVGLVSIFTSFFARGFCGGYIRDKDNEKKYNGQVNTAIKDLPKIKDINFISADFNEILKYSNCVIYVDPPYKDTKKYDTAKNFDYGRFWETMRLASENNIVFISEMTAPEDFIEVWALDGIRNIGEAHVKCTEKLFIYSIDRNKET